MKYIKELTEEQKNMMPLWAQKWTNIGLKTGDADWDTFNKYMPVCYEKAGFKYPKRIIRVSSPIVGGLASSIAEKMLRAKRDSAVGGAVSGAVDSAVGGAVSGAVSGAVGGAVHDAVSGAVDSAVGGAVRVAVDSAVGGAVHDAVGGAVRVAVDSAVDSAVGGAVDSAKLEWHYWLGGQFWVGGWWGSPSYVSFFTDVCGLELNEDIAERAEAYRKICESVNYIWANRDFVMVCDRPKTIQRDSVGRLHSLTGKAIEYKDGWGLYMIHGIRFAEQEWIDFTSGKMTAIEIMCEKNQDKKRAMILAYGNEKVIKELKANKLAEEIDSCGNPMRIWEITRKEDEPLLFYEGTCPSKKEIVYLRIPPTLKDKRPIEAKCWTFKRCWEDYQKTGVLPEFVTEA